MYSTPSMLIYDPSKKLTFDCRHLSKGGEWLAKVGPCPPPLYFSTLVKLSRREEELLIHTCGMLMNQHIFRSSSQILSIICDIDSNTHYSCSAYYTHDPTKLIWQHTYMYMYIPSEQSTGKKTTMI